MIDLLRRADELNGRIMEEMTKVEQCEDMINIVNGKELVFLDDSNNGYISIKNVLSDQQMEDMRLAIIDIIMDNQAEAKEFLERMIGFSTESCDLTENLTENNQEESRKPAIEEPEFKAITDKMVEEVKAEVKAEKKPEPVRKTKPGNKTMDELKEVLTREWFMENYVGKELSIQAIADEFGADKNMVYRLKNEYGIPSNQQGRPGKKVRTLV